MFSLYKMAENKSIKYYQDKEFLKQIGIRIRSRRINNGLSIQRLAKENGMDYSQIARMERGEVNFTISYLFRIAKAFNIKAKELLP